MTLCADLIDGKTLAAMNMNDGDGPTSEHICTEMADRFEEWMITNSNGHELKESILRVTTDGRFVSKQEMMKNPNLKTKSPYYVSPEHLRMWVDFLRHCGGFQVW